jgi:sec-independent protein translocase protein TatC
MGVLPRRVGHRERAELVEHLGELRHRLAISAVTLGLAFAVTFIFRETVIGWLNGPLEGKEPITLGVAEPFTTSLLVSLYAALALSLPVLFWQAWAYLAPALDERTQKSIARLVVLAALVLAAGMAFAYWVVLPSTIPFLLDFDDELYQIEVRARDYYSFAALTVVGVGALFELPVFLLGLVRLGVLSAERLRRSRRVGVVVLVAISVALPGVDPVTTLLQTAPLLVLFEASIRAAPLVERHRTKATLAAQPQPAAES